jgi:thiol:disulfide interchange protein DsbA
MLKLLRRAIFILLVLPLVACAESDRFQEGDHYIKLSKSVATKSSGKIEVLELFWYGCPHCYSLEPSLNAWTAKLPSDVQFERMPAFMASGWEAQGRAYYTAEVLGVVEQTHEALFKAIHMYKQRMGSQKELSAFYASHGVDEARFNKAFKSFAVQSKINQAKLKQRDYRASGVPAIIVNGKYRISQTMKAGAQGMFEVIDFLIAKERALMPKS